jgi:flagellar assembly protein FliH
MAEQKNEISNYEFKNFSIGGSEQGSVEDYSFQDLNDFSPATRNKDLARAKIERVSAEKRNFIISPIVKEHRGLLDQEKVERERKIVGEVSRRVEMIKEEAYKDGFAEGIEAGKQDVYNQTKAESEDKLNILTEMINEVLVVKENIITNQKDEVYKLVRNLTKWVILKELKDDGDYISRLLEKLIVEAQTTSNLLIQVNQQQFSAMPEVLKTVQAVVGKLDNVRVEIDYDISENGIVVDSDNGIIRGTIEQQFESLDKLFETVIPDEQ